MTPKFHNDLHFKNFWEKGNGKELLDWADLQPNPLVFQKYAPLYHQVDVLGDDVVKETYLKLKYKDASALIQKYSEQPIAANDDEPESLKKFFLQLQEIPDWYDQNLANAGHDSV